MKGYGGYFDGQLVVSQYCKMDQDEITKRQNALNNIYFPFGDDNTLDVLENGRDALYDDLKYYQGRKVLASLLSRSTFLKSHKNEIKSFSDAYLFYANIDHDIAPLYEVSAQPLLKPDNSIRTTEPNPISDADVSKGFISTSLLQHYIVLFVDYQEADGTLRCKSASVADENSFTYAWLRINKNSKVFGQNNISIGSRLRVIGKYVENRKYVTMGGPKIAPVIDVLYYNIK